MPNPVKASFEVQTQKFASGTVAVGFLLTLTGQPSPIDGTTPADVTATAGLDATDITIPDVPVGVYVGSIALVDASNKPVSPAVSDPAPITIAAVADVSFPVPTTLTLTRP